MPMNRPQWYRTPTERHTPQLEDPPTRGTTTEYGTHKAITVTLHRDHVLVTHYAPNIPTSTERKDYTNYRALTDLIAKAKRTGIEVEVIDEIEPGDK